MEEKSIDKMNIFEKVSAISNEIETVAKNLKIEYGNTKYKAVGEADVLKAVKPLENKYGVYSYPLTREIIESGEIEQKTGSKYLFMRVKTIYRFVNIQNPSEFIDQESLGDGVDSQDKAPGKAMTYSDKYSLLKAYKIETGDDPDQEPSKDLQKSYVKNMKNTKSQYRELMEKIDGTPLTQENLNNFIKTKWGKSIRFNDLTKEQFEELKNAIDQKVTNLMGE